jgi:hypothetical protein
MPTAVFCLSSQQLVYLGFCCQWEQQCSAGRDKHGIPVYPASGRLHAVSSLETAVVFNSDGHCSIAVKEYWVCMVAAALF